jgi:hypothetical protein
MSMDIRSHKRPHWWVRLSVLRFSALSLGTWSPTLRDKRSGLIFYAWNKNQASALSRNARNRLLTDTSSYPRRTCKVSLYCPNRRRHTTIKRNTAYFNVFLLLRHSPGSTEENKKLQRKLMPDSGSNPVFFKTGHRQCHCVYVQGIAICSAVMRRCVHE